MNATLAGHTFGTGLAASNFGIGRRALLRRQAMHDVMSSEEGVPFERQLCKLAAELFEQAGDANSPACILFRRLEKVAEWNPAYNRFTDHVRRALAMRKEAMTLLPAAAALHDSTGGGMLKTLTAGGALGGAALGSLAFLLSRNAEQSSAENAALMEKIRAYRQLKRDIEEDMSSSVAAPAAKPTSSRYDV